MKHTRIMLILAVLVVHTARASYTISPGNGPLVGGNTVLITNAVPVLGNGSDITNVIVGSVAATRSAQGANWVAFVPSGAAIAGVQNIVIQSTSMGATTLSNAYTYNPAGRISNSRPFFGALSAGYYQSLAVKTDGSVAGWGNSHNMPPPNTNFIAVSGGWNYSLALRSDGTIAWGGYNGDGRAAPPSPNSNFVAIAADGIYSLGLQSNGMIVAWGSNMFGVANVPAPNTNFVAVAAGSGCALGLKSDGTITTWGLNAVLPTPNSDFVAIAAGHSHRLGLRAAGTIAVWGWNDQGQLNAPVPNADFTAVAAGLYHSLGLKSDGTIVGWGRNNEGQTVVPSPNSNFVAVAAGWYHSLGLKSDGTIIGWGRNSEGQTTVPEPNANFRVPEDGIFPSAGDHWGGYQVVIHGTNLSNGSDITNVTLCGASMRTIVTQSATRVVIIADTGRLGLGDVRIYSTSFGETIKSNAFKYTGTNATLSIQSLHGMGSPPVGVCTNLLSVVLTNRMNSPVIQDATQYVCSGWTMTGNAPASGSGTQCVMTVTNDAVLTWLWTTNYWLATSNGPHGCVNVSSGWQAFGAATTLTAQAEAYFHFTKWTGSVTTVELYANPLSLLMTTPKSVTAYFAEDQETNGTPHWWLAQYGLATNETGANYDDGDDMPAWAEYVAGTDPTNPASVLRIFGVDDSGRVVGWTSVSGRLYTVLYGSNLLTGFQVLGAGSNLPATPSRNNYTNTTATNIPSLFYRIKVAGQ
jgi:hypothetical protein